MDNHSQRIRWRKQPWPLEYPSTCVIFFILRVRFKSKFAYRNALSCQISLIYVDLSVEHDHITVQVTFGDEDISRYEFIAWHCGETSFPDHFNINHDLRHFLYFSIRNVQKQVIYRCCDDGSTQKQNCWLIQLLNEIDRWCQVLYQEIWFSHYLIHVVVVFRWFNDMFIFPIEFFPKRCLMAR